MSKVTPSLVTTSLPATSTLPATTSLPKRNLGLGLGSRVRVIRRIERKTMRGCARCARCARRNVARVCAGCALRLRDLQGCKLWSKAQDYALLSPRYANKASLIDCTRVESSHVEAEERIDFAFLNDVRRATWFQRSRSFVDIRESF